MSRMILIVDDEKSIQEVLAESLELGGYQSCTASDGIEGIRQLCNLGPDLIITDIRMPNLDGIEFCRLVRQESDVPIIIITGIGSKPQEFSDSNLIDAFMSKPVHLTELLAQVAALLGDQPQTD